MQTTRTLDKGTNSEERSRRRAIGANLLVVGTLCLLAAIALFILVSDPGEPVSTVVPARLLRGGCPGAIGGHAFGDLDRSWLCNLRLGRRRAGRPGRGGKDVGRSTVSTAPGHAESRPSPAEPTEEPLSPVRRRHQRPRQRHINGPFVRPR